jgi:hypothetical protein
MEESSKMVVFRGLVKRASLGGQSRATSSSYMITYKGNSNTLPKNFNAPYYDFLRKEFPLARNMVGFLE